MNEIQNIVLIGTGNVTTYLGLAIPKTGKRVEQIYSRTEENARLLSTKVSSNLSG